MPSHVVTSDQGNSPPGLASGRSLLLGALTVGHPEAAPNALVFRQELGSVHPIPDRAVALIRFRLIRGRTVEPAVYVKRSAAAVYRPKRRRSGS